MKAIDFKEKNIDIGKDQEIYETLPGKVISEPEMRVFSKWELDVDDLKRINEDGCVWLSQMTFGKPFQPVLVQTQKPDFKKIDEIAKSKIVEEIEKENKNLQNELPPEVTKNLRATIKKGGRTCK